MASVFISYSRKDHVFVRTLYDALATASRDAWVDWEGIPPTAEWLSEVYKAIDGSDSVIFMLSPDSLASQTCGQEVAYALESKKRIVPVVCRSVEGAEVRAVEALAPLAALNWIFMRASDDFTQAFTQLRFALDTDLDYWHLSSDLLVRAKKWEAGAKNATMTLRGPELIAAERWVTQGADKEPRPTAAQLDYIHASRRATSLLQRRLFAGVSAALAITLVLAILSTVLYQVTLGQNQTLSAEALAGQATSDFLANNIDQGLLLSVEATRRSDAFATRSALLSGLEGRPYLEAVLHDTSAVSANSFVGATALALSANGQAMVSTNPDGGITIWDMQKRQPRLHLPTDLVQAATISPDGRIVATKDTSGLTFWDAQTGVPRARIAGISGLFDFGGPLMAFSPDGTLLASVDDTLDQQGGSVQAVAPRVDVWDVAAGVLRQSLPLNVDPSVAFLAFSPNGTQVAVSLDGCVAAACGTALSEAFVWELATTAVTSIYRLAEPGSSTLNSTATNLVFTPDGTTLVLAGCVEATCGGPDVRFWNVAAHVFAPGGLDIAPAGRQVRFLLALSPDGRTLVTAASLTSLQLWDMTSLAPIGPPLSATRATLFGVAFSPDGQQLVSIEGDQQLLMWRTTPFTPFGIPDDSGSNQVILPLVFTQGTRQVVGAEAGGDVVAWNVVSGQRDHILSHVTATKLTGLAVSADGRTVAVCDDAGNLSLWDLTTGTRLETLRAAGADLTASTQLAFRADGRYLLAEEPYAARVFVWDVSTGQLVYTSNQATAAAFSADGRFLAIAAGMNASGTNGAPGTDVILLEASGSAWQEEAHLRRADSSVWPITAVAFSADGRLVAGLSEHGALYLWNANAGAPTHTLDVRQLATVEDIPSVAFGRLGSAGDLLIVTESESILLWNTQTGALLAQPIVDPHGIQGTSVSSDGQLLAETDGSGMVSIRYATETAWQASACHIANRNLTHAEWSQFFPGESYKKTCSDLPAGA